MAADFGSDALVVLAAVAEACLAISFLVRRTPRVSAVGLVALGAAFCAWTLIRGPELKSGRPCGCYGPYRLEFLPHLAVASGILMAGGVHLLLHQQREPFDPGQPRPHEPRP